MPIRRCTASGILLLALAGLAGDLLGCGGFRPYRLMAKTAASEEDVFSQAEDKHLRLQVRGEILETESFAGLSITPYVFMGRAFLVGFVANEAQRSALSDAVRELAGIRSLETYLPEHSGAGSVEASAQDVAIEAELKARIAADPAVMALRVSVKVLDGHAVLLGVVDSQASRESAERSAKGAAGVIAVTNFLLLPEPGYERLRPTLIR